MSGYVRILDMTVICVLSALESVSTEGPMWGHPMPVLGALSPFLEPFCGHLSPKLDKVS